MKDGVIKNDGTSRRIYANLPATYEDFRMAAAQGDVLADVLFNADGWQQQPDFLNKRNLLQDVTAGLFGLGTDAVPDDVLAYLGKYEQHWWRRSQYKVAAESVGQKELIDFSGIAGNDVYSTVVYSNSVSIMNGKIQLSGSTKTVNIGFHQVDSGSVSTTILKNKYFYVSYRHSSATSDLSNDVIYFSGGSLVLSGGYAVSLSSVSTLRIEIANTEYVQSSSRSAYPDSGEQDGYEYQYLGIPFENSVTAPKIATGSYVGTGKYGPDNPNSLTFEFPPKLLFITQRQGEGNFWGADGIGRNPIDCSILTTSYAAGLGFSSVSRSDGLSGYAKKTEGGKTITWYHSRSVDSQANAQYTYYYFAIG